MKRLQKLRSQAPPGANGVLLERLRSTGWRTFGGRRPDLGEATTISTAAAGVSVVR